MTKLILPTPSQAEWAEREIGVIIHLDLPVFSNDVRYNFREHYGDPLPAELFNPDDMDVESWIRAARDLGAKYAVLVAKHCTGFCLWPTKAHGYSVASSPWKDGQGDVVREFVDACRKYDILPGLYYSVSCNQYMNVDNPGLVRDRDPEKQRAYNEMALEQLTELWTNYGELFEIWFDGGCLPPEEGGPDVAALLSHLQPNAVVFQGPRGLPSRLRWVGNERGVADENCSSIMNEGAELLDGTREVLAKGDTLGDTWRPAESDLPGRDAHRARAGGWFWAPDQEDTVKSGEELLETYIKSVGRGTNMLVGMAIDAHGRFPEADTQAFRRFAALKRAAFGEEKAAFQSAGAHRYIASAEGARFIALGEDIRQGERVLAWRVTGYDAENRAVMRRSGTVIGHRRIVPVSGKSVRFELEITAFKAMPVLTELSVY